MRKLWVLLKLNFRAMLRAFSFRSGAGSSKKKAAGGLGALLLMAFLALYLSGVYSFLLASMLAEVGIVEMVLPLMALMACVMSLMFTLFAASGLVFGGKDSDIVLALPVPAFTVMLSKINFVRVFLVKQSAGCLYSFGCMHKGEGSLPKQEV